MSAGVNPVLAGIACRCPNCGEGPLFSGFLLGGAALVVENAIHPPAWLHLASEARRDV